MDLRAEHEVQDSAHTVREALEHRLVQWTSDARDAAHARGMGHHLPRAPAPGPWPPAPAGGSSPNPAPSPCTPQGLRRRPRPKHRQDRVRPPIPSMTTTASGTPGDPPGAPSVREPQDSDTLGLYPDTKDLLSPRFIGVRTPEHHDSVTGD